MYKKISGIYRITCLSNGKHYIGSAQSIKARWASHKNNLKHNKHSNRHLQNAYNKFGAENFEFEVIELCNNDNLIEREQYWIDCIDASNPDVGMNNSPTATTTKGFRHSVNTINILKEKAKNRDHSHLKIYTESLRGKPAHNKGKPGMRWTDDMKKRASESHIGQVAWNKGIKHKLETRIKTSETLKSKGINVKYKDDTRNMIYELRDAGLSYPQIADKTGVSMSQCHKICKQRQGIFYGRRV